MDLWTAAHLLGGLALGLAGRRLATAAAAAFGWEWVEASLRATWSDAWAFGVGDSSWANGFVDVAAVLAAWGIVTWTGFRVVREHVDGLAMRLGW